MTPCALCDTRGPCESRTDQEWLDLHRAGHALGTAMWEAMVLPWAVPVVEWLSRTLAR